MKERKKELAEKIITNKVGKEPHKKPIYKEFGSYTETNDMFDAHQTEHSQRQLAMAVYLLCLVGEEAPYYYDQSGLQVALGLGDYQFDQIFKYLTKEGII